MLCKLVFVASLAVGVFGRTVLDAQQYDAYDPYDQYSEQIATEYCKVTNAEDKVPEVKASIKTFAKCMLDVIDTDEFRTDIEEATSNGVEKNAGIVKKYCAKSPQLKDCTRDLIKGVAPCLPPGSVRTSEKSTFALIDFVCDNDGARITSFLKEDGPQCIQHNQFKLALCQRDMKDNITKVANVYGGGAAGALMVTEKERCGIVDNGLACLANVMKSCTNQIPGNLAQELHDVYLKSMSCSEETYETQTEAVIGKVEVAPQTLLPSSMNFLVKRKLELEVRNAELEIWNRENELRLQHTILTSDVKSRL